MPQTFNIHGLALVQYLGGTGTGNVAINNTSTNSLMEANGNKGILIGGSPNPKPQDPLTTKNQFNTNELLGGPGQTEMFGRGYIDYILANYTVNFSQQYSKTSNGTLVPSKQLSNNNYIYGWPTNRVYVLAKNATGITQTVNTNGAKANLPTGSGIGLTILEWLEANFVTPASILAASAETPPYCNCCLVVPVRAVYKNSNG